MIPSSKLALATCSVLAVAAMLLPGGTVRAAELILADNFDAPDIANFDNSDQTGRRSGLAAADIQLRSARRQHTIIGNQLDLAPPAGGSGRVRFHDANDLTTWWDWSSGAAGSKILTDGGFRVEFDWTPPDTTGTQWVSWNVGFSQGAEPGIRVNNAETDFGILFRSNGNTQRFNNGGDVADGGSFAATDTLRHVIIEYQFTSWADGSEVTVNASVDGTEVLPGGYTFDWDNNAGGVSFELGTNIAGTLIDNFSLETIVPDGFAITLGEDRFFSSIGTGGAVGTLATLFEGTPETAVFTFATGDGDADNSKFQLDGAELQLGAGFDFLDEPDGTEYSIRIGAVGDDSGQSGEQSFTLTLIADSDSDTLPDTWELAKTPNLDDLNGLGVGVGPGAGTGDFDGDELSDFAEWQLDLNEYPGIDPTDADSDDDELDDGEEVAGAGDRPATSPIDADTDDDSIGDSEESNSGIFASAEDTGSDPTLADTDGDEYQDGFELLRGGDPNIATSIPPLSAAVSLAVLTDDASTGIDSTKTYTHAISGGGAVTVNGVLLEDFSPTVIPADLLWDTGGLSMNQIVTPNNGDWDPALGGVTGVGLLELLGGFTYSGSGANPGSAQTYRLSGLTAGQSYSLRLYVRLWDTDGVGRPIDLSFDNGGTISYAPILEDRPATVLGDPTGTNAAYMIEYRYVAAGADLAVRAELPVGATVPSGSYHLFGLTNEVGGPLPLPTITEVSYDDSGALPAFVITFESIPDVKYALDFSTSLKAEGTPGGWLEGNDTIPSQGTSTTTTMTGGPATFPRAYFRLRIPEQQ